ncbi:aspartate aminotransferase family protein [Aestuariibius sp. HNIBRBA575]|uniref:pyridoxal phosphate-dependent decarboxylase family protein n=1 Tax=Aestuariibius sp. HNIBRBA575 TaxID=3233343 RepID=UPI0034A489F8
MTNSKLDPENWDDFRAQAHRLLDTCLKRLENAADFPWVPVPEDIKQSYEISGSETKAEALVERLTHDVLPYHTGNTHPQFFGWVHGTGLASGLLSEMVAATMNSNCGGRDHGATYMERAVIDWTRKVMGLPDTTSGVLVTGTSQATVIALSAARLKTLGAASRKSGNDGAKLVAYAGAGVHTATKNAIELLGFGSDALRLVPDDGPDGMDLSALQDLIAQDRKSGLTPFAIIGTAGSVDRGHFDDLNGLADIAQTLGVWLHVDGAFGAWTRLADDPWHGLTDGIGRVDSMACDFHKWMSVPYDCGLVLIRQEADHRAAFAARPSYLAAQQDGLGAGDPWFCDYGIDLSRGNRALKVWTALELYGQDRFGQAISENCRLAGFMGDLVTAHADMALMAPVLSNVCIFTANASLDKATQSDLNTLIAQRLQIEGKTVFSTTNADGIVCLRAAIVNHRTQNADVQNAISNVHKIAQTLSV